MQSLKVWQVGEATVLLGMRQGSRPRQRTLTVAEGAVSAAFPYSLRCWGLNGLLYWGN